ncbi:hypothetical protein PIB30_025971 [Stylosanthes scabra]|uniref:Uncharacterized protein n=1 Tax=Stylosanthes scabra TaxID=79078 RepID=A0ABU6SAV2_9FABA|nr:hypothetical protein [Stylosanthes scabra]
MEEGSAAVANSSCSRSNHDVVVVVHRSTVAVAGDERTPWRSFAPPPLVLEGTTVPSLHSVTFNWSHNRRGALSPLLLVVPEHAAAAVHTPSGHDH